MYSNDKVKLESYKCSSGANMATASTDAVMLEQYVNESGSYRSNDIAIHNVVSVKQKTRTIPADINGKPFKVRELTIVTKDAGTVLLKLFMDNGND